MPGPTRRISRGSIARSQEGPTTGNGQDEGQKPNLDETNLDQDRTADTTPLIRRSTDGGRHS